AICPLITTTGPISYFIVTIALRMCPGLVSGLMASATSSITLLNPLTTIFFMRCYRQVILSPFRRKRTAPMDEKTFTKGLSLAPPSFVDISAPYTEDTAS
ncbi:hypothetical protein AAVH_31049, partial [Aphelenchoides avenae]